MTVLGEVIMSWHKLITLLSPGLWYCYKQTDQMHIAYLVRVSLAGFSLRLCIMTAPTPKGCEISYNRIVEQMPNPENVGTWEVGNCSLVENVNGEPVGNVWPMNLLPKGSFIAN